MKFHNLFYLMFSFGFIYSMESPGSDMVPIKKWEDVKPFAGKIVAYIMSSDFYLSENGCSFADENIKYGYISKGFCDWIACDRDGKRLYPHDFNKDRGWGYSINQLITSENRSFSYKPLVNFRLKEAQLQMRCVHLDEVVTIGEYIENRKACFEGEWHFVKGALLCLIYGLRKITLMHAIVDDILPHCVKS